MVQRALEEQSCWAESLGTGKGSQVIRGKHHWQPSGQEAQGKPLSWGTGSP